MSTHLRLATRTASAFMLMLGISGVSMLGSTTIAHASFYCPTSTGSDNQANMNYREYAIGPTSAVVGCEWGQGNISQSSSFTSSNYLGITSGYPGNPNYSFPTSTTSNTNSTFLNLAGGTNTALGAGSVLLTDNLTSTISGTLQFNSGFIYNNVYVVLEDGTQLTTDGPRWASFYLGTINAANANVLIDLLYLTCNSGGSSNATTKCVTTPTDGAFGNWGLEALTQLSNIEIFASSVVSAPLPGALALFASGIGLIGFAARKRRKTARLATA
jgi:hypothetical protein